MNKLNQLRHHLMNAVPTLKRDPERLLTFVEDGRIEFHRGPTLSHEYQYTAQLILTDYAGETDAVIIPLLDWLSAYQPDADPAEAVSFEAEILTHRTVDLALRVRLSERVVATRDCATGEIHAEHRAPYFAPPECPEVNWQLLIRERLGGGFIPAGQWPTPGGNDGQ
jgi:hypothetical protein